MELMAFPTHMHRRRLARGGDGSQVRVDVILP